MFPIVREQRSVTKSCSRAILKYLFLQNAADAKYWDMVECCQCREWYRAQINIWQPDNFLVKINNVQVELTLIGTTGWILWQCVTLYWMRVYQLRSELFVEKQWRKWIVENDRTLKMTVWLKFETDCHDYMLSLKCAVCSLFMISSSREEWTLESPRSRTTQLLISILVLWYSLKSNTWAMSPSIFRSRLPYTPFIHRHYHARTNETQVWHCLYHR